jgi:hypothetical protein
MWCVPNTAGLAQSVSTNAAVALAGSFLEHVQADTDALGLDRVGERRIIDHLGPGGVDDVGADLGVLQEIRVHEAARLFRQREVHAHDVGPRQQLGRRIHDFDAVLFPGRGARLRIVGKTAAPHHDRHAERTRALSDLAANVTEAEEAERLPHQPLRLRVFLLVPGSRPQLGDVVGDPPIERQDQPHRQLGDGDGVFPRAIRYVDAALRCCRHVDGVDSGAGADDERQRARIHHRIGDLGRSHDQHRRLRLLDSRNQCVARRLGLENDFAACRLQRIETGPLELICDENFHPDP